METITISTKTEFQLLDITSEIESLVVNSQVASGIILVFTPHTTAGIICNESETNLKEDILKVLKALEQNSKFFGGFEHDRDEGNAHAHIVSSISGNSQSFIVENGRLKLGVWQNIMLLEMDGPREREIWVQIISNE